MLNYSLKVLFPTTKWNATERCPSWDDSFKEKLTSPNYQIIDLVRIEFYQAHYFLLEHKK